MLQSNYIPWKGYFDIIAEVDEFILYDTAQMTKNDWRNRNMIKTAEGPRWLTIPVRHHLGRSIEDTETAGAGWARKHWLTLTHNYHGAPAWNEYAGSLASLYQEASGERFLSRINYIFLAWICGVLGINTRLTWSRDYRASRGGGDRLRRLVDLCIEAGATEYLSGPAAKEYIDEATFLEAGIKVIYANYAGYPEYPQLHGPFKHQVSILDLLLNAGREARQFMKAQNV